MKKNYGVLDEIGRLFGLVVLAVLVIGGIALLLYGLLDTMSDTGRHWLAVALVMCLPLAFALGLQIGKAHVAGVKTGLDLKLSARERAAAKPIGPVLPQPPTPARNLDDILPKVGTMQIIDAPQGRGEIVD